MDLLTETETVDDDLTETELAVCLLALAEIVDDDLSSVTETETVDLLAGTETEFVDQAVTETLDLTVTETESALVDDLLTVTETVEEAEIEQLSLTWMSEMLGCPREDSH